MANPMIRLAAALGLTLLCAAGPARAGDFDKTHPRRAQVNGRLNNQNKRIDQGEKNGTLTRGQARQLHQEDRGIRKEERQDAAANGGHITRQQQRQINRQENRTSKQIHQEEQP
jgi:hypothetical protein